MSMIPHTVEKAVEQYVQDRMYSALKHSLAGFDKLILGKVANLLAHNWRLITWDPRVGVVMSSRHEANPDSKSTYCILFMDESEHQGEDHPAMLEAFRSKLDTLLEVSK